MKYHLWAEQWLDYYIKSSVKERTYVKYRRLLHTYILPELGNKDMDEITATDLQKLTAGLTTEGLAPNTVNGIISVLKATLNKANMLGIVEKKQSDLIVRPKAREKQITCFERNEQKKLENYILQGKRMNLYGIILSLYTGLRIGELLALEWSDVDFKKCVLTVRSSCHDSWQNGKYIKICDTPKTECSYRTIPIPKQLIPYLKAMKKAARCSFVVDGRTPYGAQIRSYQRTFKLVLKKLSLPYRSFHTLRHTFATRALECGVDVRTLSEILGHKNPNITLRRYAHSLMTHKTEMMNKIGKLLQ